MKLFITTGDKLMGRNNQHMKHTQIRPKEGNYVDWRAEMDLLVALSACPDLAVGGKPVNVMIYESSPLLAS